MVSGTEIQIYSHNYFLLSKPLAFSLCHYFYNVYLFLVAELVLIFLFIHIFSISSCHAFRLSSVRFSVCQSLPLLLLNSPLRLKKNTTKQKKKTPKSNRTKKKKKKKNQQKAKQNKTKRKTKQTKKKSPKNNTHSYFYEA